MFRVWKSFLKTISLSESLMLLRRDAVVRMFLTYGNFNFSVAFSFIVISACSNLLRVCRTFYPFRGLMICKMLSCFR